ncbi:MAG: EFR1 family ferrodoxin [Clostridiaceae bacterium]|nr:EFR1 family ferrodoxin [Clostridiaceae bacterium]
MSKNVIYYFSGTGNSLKAAKDIAAVIGDTRLAFMTENAAELCGEYDRIGFVFPCYAGGAPAIVLNFIRNLKTECAEIGYIFAVVTCNVSVGNSFYAVRKALAAKGLELGYCGGSQAPGNYVIEYPIEKDAPQKIKRADEAFARFAADIQNKSLNSNGKLLNPFFALFYRIGQRFFKMMEKRFRVTEDCVSCGLCAKLCPVGNIEITDGKPVFLHKDCASCLACLHWCPRAAIECGQATVKHGRYRHPSITPKDMTENRN